MPRPTDMTALVLAVGRWLRARGGPRIVERETELALEEVARKFFG